MDDELRQYAIEQGWITEVPIEPTTPIVPYDRGTTMDLISQGLRGVADTAKLTGNALKVLGVDNSIPDYVKAAEENFSILQEDLGEVRGYDGPVVRGLKSIPRVVTSSVGTGLLGAAAGWPLGAGAALASGFVSNVLLMGLGTGREAYESYLKEHPGDEEGAIEYGIKYGAAESGGEGLSNLIALGSFGTSSVINAVGKQGIKATVRNLLSFSPKTLAKAAGVSAAGEFTGEELTYAAQASLEEGAGMGPGITLEGLTETGVSTLGMSMLFSAAGAKYQKNQRDALKRGLESDSKLAQLSASNIISKELEKSGDLDLAQAWNTYTQAAIVRGEPIKLDDNFIQLADEIDKVKANATDIASDDPLVQKTAVDKILKSVGIDESGAVDYAGLKNLGKELDSLFPKEEEGVPTEFQTPEELWADRYRKDSNITRTIGDFLTSQEDKDALVNLQKLIAKKDSIRQGMSELEEDSNNVRLEVIQQMKELEAKALAQAQAVASKAPKGSKRQKAAVKATQQLTPKVSSNVPTETKTTLPLVESSTPGAGLNIQSDTSGTPGIQETQKVISFETPQDAYDNNYILEKPVFDSVQRAQAAVVDPEQEILQIGSTYRIARKAQTESRGVGLGITKEDGVITSDLNTPETELIRQQEQQALEQSKEVSGTQTTFDAVVEKANDPMLTALRDRDEKTLRSLIPDKYLGNQAYLYVGEKLKALLDPKTAQTIMGDLRDSLQWVNSIYGEDIQKDQPRGSRATDPIKWAVESQEETSEYGPNHHVGWHKETNQEVMVFRSEKGAPFMILVSGKDPVQFKGTKEQALRKANTLVAPLSEATLKQIKESTSRKGKALLKNPVKKETPKVTQKKGDPNAPSEVKIIPKKEYVPQQKSSKVSVTEFYPEDEVKEEEIQEAPYEEVPHVARMALSRANQNAKEAIRLYNLHYKNKNEDPQSLKYLQQLQYTQEGNTLNTLPKILDHIRTNGTKIEKLILNVLDKAVNEKKLEGIRLVVDTNLNNSYFFGNTIYLDNPYNTKIALHEYVHAISVRELKNNEVMQRRLTSLMNLVFQKVQGKRLLTPEQIEYIKKNNTSVKFRENLEGMNFSKDQNSLAYALINPFEFLSQSMSDRYVQEILKDIQVDDGKSRLRKAWDKFVNIIAETLGISNLYNTALGQVLDITTELAGYDYTQSSNEIHGAPSASTWIDIQGDKASQAKTYEDYKAQAKGFLKDTETLISKAAQSTFSAVENISPKIANSLRWMESQINTKIKRRTEGSSKFFLDKKELDKSDQQRINFYLMNFDVAEIRERLESLLDTLSNNPKTASIKKNYESMLKVLKDIREDIDVVSLLQYKTFGRYFPRVVKDIDGLVTYLRNRNYFDHVSKMVEENRFEDLKTYLEKKDLLEEVEDFVEARDWNTLVSYFKERYDWGVLDEAVESAKDQATKEKRAFTSQDRIDAINNVLTRRLPAAYLRTPTGVKKRSIRRVNAEMMKFYYTPDEAFGRLIREVTERVEINKILGVSKYNDLNEKIEINLIKTEKETDPKKLAKLEEEFNSLLEQLPKQEDFVENSIPEFIKQEVKKRALGAEEQRRLTELLKARFTQVGAGRVVGFIRNLSVMSSLTQLSTAFRNVGDIIWNPYKYGYSTTALALKNILTKEGVIKENPFDFHNPLKEFDTINRFIDKTLTPLKLVDDFFKAVAAESSLIQAKKMSKEEFLKEWSDRFPIPDKAEKAYDDIQKDKMSEEAQFVWYYNIAQFHPVDKTSMSQWFNQAGDARIFWFLKTYSLQAANTFYNEGFKKIRQGIESNLELKDSGLKGEELQKKRAENNKLINQGLKNIVHLTFLFAIAGAPVDWLIDWFNGHEPDYSKSLIDTLLTLGLTSRYTLDKGRTDGYFKSMAGTIFPPLNLLDLPLKDLVSLFGDDPATSGSVKLVPGVGVLLYNYLTEDGKKRVINSNKRRIYEDLRDEGKVDYDLVQRINKEVRSFNTRFNPAEKLKPITPGTIASIKKEQRKKENK